MTSVEENPFCSGWRRRSPAGAACIARGAAFIFCGLNIGCTFTGTLGAAAQGQPGDSVPADASVVSAPSGAQSAVIATNPVESTHPPGLGRPETVATTGSNSEPANTDVSSTPPTATQQPSEVSSMSAPGAPTPSGPSMAVPTNAPGLVCEADALWGANMRFSVVDPRDFGAKGDGTVDDLGALEAAVAALPASGGVVMLSAGTYLKAHRLWVIERHHTLLWAPGGDATIHGTVRPRTEQERSDASYCGPREQATIFKRTQGGGVHGLRFSSNATERLSCAETNQLVLDSVRDFEGVGIEISGSSGTGIFAWRSDDSQPITSNLRLVGNYIHHTYSDAIHHTSGTRQSWVWDNDIFNEAPSNGDDGIACVTYGVTNARCGNMEWWNNRYFGGGNGRGLAVVGGEDISAHHNWIIGAPAAGLIVASEASYHSSSSARIVFSTNWLLRTPNGTVNNGHPSILVSGANPEAGPLDRIRATNNVVVSPSTGGVERAEGQYQEVEFSNISDANRLPKPPELSTAGPRDTSVLKTWDTSFVAESERRGLYRIHLRQQGGQLVERFEYVVRGPKADVAAWLNTTDSGCGVRVQAQAVSAEIATSLILSRSPLEVPSSFDAPTFEQIRAGDRDGSLSWLWASLDQ